MARILVLGLVFGMIGCDGARSSDGSGGGTPQAACELGGLRITGAPFGGIDYRVVGGFSGDGDGTMLQILPDGSFTRCTRQRGMEQGQLDPAALGDVIGTARDAQFPTLSMMYPCSDCGDDFIDQVSVQFDGSVLTTLVSEFGDPPARLQALIDALRQIVGCRLS